MRPRAKIKALNPKQTPSRKLEGKRLSRSTAPTSTGASRSWQV